MTTVTVTLKFLVEDDAVKDLQNAIDAAGWYDLSQFNPFMDTSKIAACELFSQRVEN